MYYENVYTGAVRILFGYNRYLDVPCFATLEYAQNALKEDHRYAHIGIGDVSAYNRENTTR